MKLNYARGALALFTVLTVSCSTSNTSSTPAQPVAPQPVAEHTPVINTASQVYRGKASWYSIRTNGGTQTASGERLRDGALTAAHRSLPFGTLVKVINNKNGKDVVVRITDRGPYIRGRIIDVSLAAARRIEMINAGVVPVTIEILEENPPTESRESMIATVVNGDFKD